MNRPPLTPSQTVGPFFDDGLLHAPRNVLASEPSEGERIRLEGYVYDGDQAPIADAVVEIWQANTRGRYHHPADRRPLSLDPAFAGFGRCGTDAHGHYWFDTVKPGPVPAAEGRNQAPHVNLAVLARGLLDQLMTRVYFEDEAAANAADPVLNAVPEGRQSTLLARRLTTPGKTVYRFDLTLQGEGETVFFDL